MTEGPQAEGKKPIGMSLQKGIQEKARNSTAPSRAEVRGQESCRKQLGRSEIGV